MIDGIEVELTTEELRGHLTRKAEYHRENQQHYESLIARHTGDTVYDRMSLDSCRSDENRHAGLAAFYKSAAERLIENETFRLKIEQYRAIFILRDEAKKT